MKKFMQFLIVAALVASAASMSFAAFVSSTTVAMTATVLSVSGGGSMTVAVKSVAGDGVAAYSLGSALNSGGTAFNTKANQYVQVAVNDNSPSWKVRIFTNDYVGTTPSTTTWGFQYGGLKGLVAGSKIAMGWQASASIVATGITAGLPSISTTTGWTYLKDVKDVDDPIAAGDSSFTASDAAGYTTVAFGNGSYTDIITPSNLPAGTVALTNRTDPFYIYTEADLSVASADTYSGTLVVDLTNY